MEVVELDDGDCDDAGEKGRMLAMEGYCGILDAWEGWGEVV